MTRPEALDLLEDIEDCLRRVSKLDSRSIYLALHDAASDLRAKFDIPDLERQEWALEGVR